MKIIEKKFDAETGVETIIERDALEAEILDFENNQARIAANEKAESELQAKRKSLLEKLGLSEEEAKILFQ